MSRIQPSKVLEESITDEEITNSDEEIAPVAFNIDEFNTDEEEDEEQEDEFVNDEEEEEEETARGPSFSNLTSLLEIGRGKPKGKGVSTLPPVAYTTPLVPKQAPPMSLSVTRPPILQPTSQVPFQPVKMILLPMAPKPAVPMQSTPIQSIPMQSTPIQSTPIQSTASIIPRANISLPSSVIQPTTSIIPRASIPSLIGQQPSVVASIPQISGLKPITGLQITPSIAKLPEKKPTVDIEAILVKMPNITISAGTAVPPQVAADINDMLQREADETLDDFEARRRLTIKLASIPDYKLSNTAAVTAGFIMMKKSKLGITYDPDIESAIAYLTALLQR